MSGLEITYLKIEDILHNPGNPRTHSKQQIERLAASIQRFGYTNPALIDENGCLIAGHGRVTAAKHVGLTEVPTIKLSAMSEADKRAYVIADNRLAELGGWSKELLSVELSYLAELDFDYDLTLTGFETPEIDVMLGGASNPPTKADPADQIPTEAIGDPVTESGDVWQIADHRLICGDATKTETFVRLLDGQSAQMIFTDPPYNVPINGHVSGLGKVRHREFAMASGEMSSEEFKGFLAKVLFNQAKFSTDGSIHFVCIDWRHAQEMLEVGTAAYHELKNICVWSKLQGGMGSLYRSAHEFVLVFKSGTEPHINNVELGKHGRYRTNVWEYRGANSFGATRDADLAMHPTVKPTAMVADAILDCSKRGDIVLDSFAGSGTTLVAAQKKKRRGYGIEIDPIYCDTIVRRMRDQFKIEITLQGDGRTFDEIAIQRQRPTAEAA